MKKTLSLIMAILVIASTFIGFVGCDDKQETSKVEAKPDFNATYKASSQFYYSANKGQTYGDSKKEFKVGETVYMQIRTKIESTKEESELVQVKLSIPYITAVDAKYYDGQTITPVYDPIQNMTVYTFNVPTNASEEVGTFIFQFIPNSEAEIKVMLEFDDTVSSIYDKQNTIKFLAAETSADGE